MIENAKGGKNPDLNSSENENDENNEINDIIYDANYNRNWLKFNNYSCRHNSFFCFMHLSFLIYSKI